MGRSGPYDGVDAASGSSGAVVSSTSGSGPSGLDPFQMSRAITWKAPAMGMARRAAANRTEDTPDPTADVRSDEDCYQDQQRVHLDRPAHDHRVQYVILDLGVGDEHHGGDDPGCQRMGEREEDRGNARQGASDSGEKVDETNPQAPQSCERYRQNAQGDEHDHPGDDRSEQVSRRVARHGTADLRP